MLPLLSAMLTSLTDLVFRRVSNTTENVFGLAGTFSEMQFRSSKFRVAEKSGTLEKTTTQHVYDKWVKLAKRFGKRTSHVRRR